MKIYRDFKQGTEDWLNIRKGKITGTSLKGVLGGPKANETEIYTLMAEKYIEEEDLNAYEIMERGGFLEPIAKALYEETTNQTVEEVGFIEADSMLGLSPDGIISDSEGKYTKAVEIKCPRGKNYIKYYMEEVIPKEYMQQVINYFVVIEELQELDFVIYNPDVTNKKISKFKIINVTRNQIEKEIQKAQKKIIDFKNTRATMENRIIN